MISLDLPAFLPVEWDHRHHNPTRFCGIRETTGRQLESAIAHERSRETAFVLTRLRGAFQALGGNASDCLSDVLNFDDRPRAGRGCAPKLVRVHAPVPEIAATPN